MTNVFDFLIRLKTVKKGEAGLPPSQMRNGLLAEHLGAPMLAKLSQVDRSRRKRRG